jgi:hypothetical protein
MVVKFLHEAWNLTTKKILLDVLVTGETDSPFTSGSYFSTLDS